MGKPAESLNKYLRNLAIHLRSRSDEMGEDAELTVEPSWTYEGRALFFTAYYLLDEAARAEADVQELVEAAEDRFFDRFEDARFNPKAVDEAFLALCQIDTGSKTVPGPTRAAEGVEERATADGLIVDEDAEDEDDEDEHDLDDEDDDSDED